MLLQIIGCIKCFESNKTISFKITDNNLLKKNTKIWERFRNLLNIKFDSEPILGYNDKHIEIKIKIYDGNVNKNFEGKKVPK